MGEHTGEFVCARARKRWPSSSLSICDYAAPSSRVISSDTSAFSYRSPVIVMHVFILGVCTST